MQDLGSVWHLDTCHELLVFHRFESEDHARPWFCLTFRYLSRVISFSTGLSPRTIQDLSSAFWGFALAEAPFNCSSELEGTNTNLSELFPPRSPLKMFHAAAAFLHRGLKGPPVRFAGRLAPGGDEGHAYGARRPLSWEPPGNSPLVAQQIGHHHLPLGVWPCLNKLSHSSSHKQLSHRRCQL